jgi:hypothetical protein
MAGNRLNQLKDRYQYITKGSVTKFEKSINRLVNEEQGLGSS